MFISVDAAKQFFLYLIDKGWICLLIIIFVVTIYYNQIKYKIIEGGIVDKQHYLAYKASNNRLINTNLELKNKLKKYKEYTALRIAEEIADVEQQVTIAIKNHRLDLHKARYANITISIAKGSSIMLDKYVHIVADLYNALIVSIFTQ